MIALIMLATAVVHAGEIKIKALSGYELWGSASVSQAFAVNPEPATPNVVGEDEDPVQEVNATKGLEIEIVGFELFVTNKKSLIESVSVFNILVCKLVLLLYKWIPSNAE